MKTASIAAIKKELREIPPEKLHELILRLAKYKKENKELLHYMLFEEDFEEGYVAMAKEEIEEGLASMNTTTLYFAKKTIRKTLRITQKYIKYSGKKTTEIELLIHFCQTLKDSGLTFSKSLAMANLYDRQLQKLIKAIGTLHEDLQYDYQEDVKALYVRHGSAI